MDKIALQVVQEPKKVLGFIEQEREPAITLPPKIQTAMIIFKDKYSQED